MRRADDLFEAEQRVARVGRLVAKTSRAAPATWPDFQRLASAASSTRPPRAQLMMRTPCLHLGERRGVDDVAGLVGERRVQGDEVGAAQQLVELDLLDAELDAPAPARGTGS